jgi:hypothetical protein
MGLDQYLYAKQYFSPSAWRGEKAKEDFDAVVNAVGATTLVYQDLPSAQVEIKVGYWRKSNQIHQWFVDNVQGGEDDCREYHVEREQLRELINLCKQVAENHDLAEELLPSQGGFFFGSTDYDEWYFGDIEETITMLEGVLKETPENWDFYYQSSW